MPNGSPEEGAQGIQVHGHGLPSLEGDVGQEGSKRLDEGELPRLILRDHGHDALDLGDRGEGLERHHFCRGARSRPTGCSSMKPTKRLGMC